MIFGEIFEHRWLLFNFVTREIRNRYISSVSGLLWALFHPLMLLVIYSFVFSLIFKVRLPGQTGVDFTGFVAIALWPWLAFQESVQRGAMAIQSNAELLRKAAFPHELLVYASVVATFAVQVVGYVVVLVLVDLFIMPMHLLMMPLLLVWMLALMILAVGLSFLLSSLQVLFPDVEHLLPPLFMVFFYSTPILYSVAMVPDRFKLVLGLNPLSYFMERIREILIHGSGLFQWPDLAVAFGSLGLFLAGRWFFRRLSPHFEDFL